VGVDVPKGLNVRSILAVPLISGNAMRTTEQTTEGVALFINKREGSVQTSFDDDDQDVTQVAGKLVAANITASTTLAAQAHNSQRVNSLLKMVTMVADPEHSVNEVMVNGILKYAREAMNAEVATLYAVSNPGRLQQVSLNERTNSGEISLLPDEALFGQGLVGLCAISKEVVRTVLNDEGKDAQAQFDMSIDSPVGYKPSSVVCCALVNKSDECLGVIVVYDKKGAFGSFTNFSDEDVVLLEGMTPVMSAIIGSARALTFTLTLTLTLTQTLALALTLTLTLTLALILTRTLS